MHDCYPTHISLVQGRTLLTISWSDGSRSDLDACTLRTNSRSAGAVRAAIEQRPAAIPQDLTITGVHPLGNYAVNLVFSDGHDRGIYPWSYLRSLNALPAAA